MSLVRCLSGGLQRSTTGSTGIALRLQTSSASFSELAVYLPGLTALHVVPGRWTMEFGLWPKAQ